MSRYMVLAMGAFLLALGACNTTHVKDGLNPEAAVQRDKLLEIEAQFTPPHSNGPLPQTFVVNLLTSIPANCIAVEGPHTTIFIDRTLLERIAGQTPGTGHNETDRMAALHSARAKQLLNLMGSTSRSPCKTVIIEQQLRTTATIAALNAAYLVGTLLNAGMAVVFHKPTSKVLAQITVTYSGNPAVGYHTYIAAGSQFLINRWYVR